jgi:hypothetical protein
MLVRVVRLITNPVVLCRLLSSPSTEASSLHQHYPASSVLQASPSPQTARPVSRELPVDSTAITAGASRVAFSPLCLHAVATTPAGWRKLFAHTLPLHRPSPNPRWVGSCILNFEACSAFTHVTACTLAESLLRPSSTGGFSGFVTSTAAPIATGRNEPVPGWDLHPLWTKRLFTAHADHLSNPVSRAVRPPKRHETRHRMQRILDMASLQRYRCREFTRSRWRRPKGADRCYAR